MSPTRFSVRVAARFAEDGVDTIDLEVMASNAEARAVYARWGFRDEVLVLAAPVAALVERLGVEAPTTSFGSIHVQTDDVDVILKAVEMFVPRLLGRSTGSIVTQPRGGYVTVYDDACDRDPAMLRRLAKEISARTGLVVIAVGVEQEALVRMILLDRGGIVDEYASVPEFHGPLPPGEVVALNANPVVVERYTGAAQAAVRAATPVARVPSDLPPARELLAGLASRARARRAPSTAGPTCPRTTRRSGSSADVGTPADRRAAVPVLRARPDRARREGHRVRDGRDRPGRSPAWVYELNPIGKVPVLERDGLGAAGVGRDQRVPRGGLPRAAAPPARIATQRANARLLIFRHDDFTDPYYALRRKEAGAEVAFAGELEALDATPCRGRPISPGKAFGLADIAYVPWVLRARDLLGVSFESYPSLVDWLARLAERPSIQAELEVIAAL